MARFIATSHGRAASTASRLGTPSTGINGTVRGWDLGMRADMFASHINDPSTDALTLSITGGSKNPRSLLELGMWTRIDGTLTPIDDTAKRILAALKGDA